ncbi:MAG TPA: aldo/keto reductase [Acidimicrobiales bacterium]|nr:aldo/keto reductase [Acidimicrobiales bacterium]
MPIRQIGSLDVSLVGLGCNNFGGRLDEPRSAEVIAAALDAGINFFDTADVYGATHSEEFLGGAIGKRRPEVVIATKFGSAIDSNRKGAAPAYVKQALEDSLRRLGTDYVDLYQLHRPDPATPIADTLGALSDLVKEGKVRELGCSNFSAAQLGEADDAAGEGAPRFVSVQNEYSLLHREPEREVLPECVALGIAFIPYFPLMSGLLSGKYHRGRPAPAGTRLSGASAERQREIFSDSKFDIIEALERYAADHGHTIVELAIAWLAAKPAVASVIAGATKPEQIQANVKGADWVLTEQEVQEVDAIAPPA